MALAISNQGRVAAQTDHTQAPARSVYLVKDEALEERANLPAPEWRERRRRDINSITRGARVSER